MKRNVLKTVILIMALLSLSPMTAWAQELSDYKVYITPPEGAVIEDWSAVVKSYINRSNFGGRMKVARDGNDIYIGGLMPGFPNKHPMNWIKGRVEENKIIIENKQLICEGRYWDKCLQYELMTATFSTEEGYYQQFCPPKKPTKIGYPVPTYYNYHTLEENLIMDYSSEYELIQRPNVGFVFVPETEENACDIYRADMTNSPYDSPFVTKIMMGKISVTDDIPSAPTSFRFAGDKRDQLFIEALPLSTEGHMLDVTKLFYRVYVDGKYYMEKPYASSSGVFDTYMSFPTSIIFDELYVVMVYEKGNKEYLSEKRYIGQADIDNIRADSIPKDISIYDLMGRKCQEPLNPGIYIKRGKKFVVK